MITSDYDARNWHSWELEPSTRQSVALLTKFYPIDKTLAAAGTAEDLITVSPGLPTVNIITNPSCETGNPPTGYTAVRSATLAQDATYYLYGTKSLKITPPNVARGEGAYWNLGDCPHNLPIGISANFRRGAAGANDARVELVASTITGYSAYTNVRLVVGNTVTLSGSWQRSQLFSPEGRNITIFSVSGASGTFTEDETITGSVSAATAKVRTVGTGWIAVDSISGIFEHQKNKYSSETVTGSSSGVTATLTNIATIPVDGNLRLYMVTATQHGTVFYADGVQAEVNSEVTPYCDGAQGLGTSWDSTVHASVSRRIRKLSCIRSMRLHTSRDVLIAYDRDASNTATNAEDKGELVRAGSDFGENHPIYLNSKISFINVNPGELPRLTGRVEGV